MNVIFIALIAIAFLATVARQIFWQPPSPEEIEAMRQAAEAAGQAFTAPVEPMQQLTNDALGAAAKSVEFAISLIGGMALFLGVMKVAEAGGLMKMIASGIRPLMVRLFPDVPAQHPAMGAMILNISANALGLGNAATPFGIQAMRELDTLNPQKGTATNAMVLFLAINTSAVTLLPTGVMVMRERLGSVDPGGIFGTTLIATFCSTTAAIFATKLFQRFAAPMPPPLAVSPDGAVVAGVAGSDGGSMRASSPPQSDTLHMSLLLLGIVGFVLLSLYYGQQVAPWVLPSLIFGMLMFGAVRGVDVYSVFVTGAKEGWNVAVMIIPYLVAILVSVAMLRASGALGAFIGVIGPLTERVGLPAEALLMAMMRPLSGSGAMGVMVETMTVHGPDSLIGYLVSTFQGSTETTFYVLAVYFGAVQVTRMRHALASAITADVVGVVAATIAVHSYLATRIL
jgi:spore maturation protein SpmA/spore maturation protein SpmB